MNKTYQELCDEILLLREQVDRACPSGHVTNALRIQVLEEFAAEQETQALAQHHPLHKAEARITAMLARGAAYRLRRDTDGDRHGEVPPHA